MISKFAIALAAIHQTVSALASDNTGSFLSRRQTSANCSSLELVFARGTDETGKFGIIVGDPLFNATQALTPGITGYSVNYPANLACDSRSVGISDAVNHVTTLSQACKGQKFALVGYSQGADVIHGALQQLPSSLYDSIVAVVQFGDPNNRGAGQLDPLGGNTSESALPAALAARIRQNCALNDPICTNNGTDISKHISYIQPSLGYIVNSAAYIQKQLQSNGQAGPDTSQDVAPGDQTDANIQAIVNLGKALGNTATTSHVCPSTSSYAATGTTATSVPTGPSYTNGTVTSSTGPKNTGTTFASSTSSGASPTLQPSTGKATRSGGVLSVEMVMVQMVALVGLLLVCL